MNYKNSEIYFLFALLASAFVIVFFIFKPFLYALILAVIFATTFAPVHKKILKTLPQYEGIAAILTVLFFLLVIVVPISLLSTQIFREATQLYSSLIDNGGAAGLSQNIEGLLRSAGFTFLPSGTLDFSSYIKQGLSFLIQNLDIIFSNVAKMMLDIFILLVALYYLFKEGSRLKKIIVEISPLRDIYDEAIFNKLEHAINGVVRGNFSVVIIQGFLTAIGLTIFGVPSPILWGSVASVAALVPGLGTSLVLVPSILFLFFSGATAGATGLFIWWVGGIGLVDNILGPRLVGRGVRLHPFLILLSILGGIIFFGPLGFLLGPLSFSLLFAFTEIYSIIHKEKSA